MAIEKHIRHSQKPREEQGRAPEKNVRNHQQRTKEKVNNLLNKKHGEIEETRYGKKKRIEFLLSEETSWSDAVHKCINADDFRLLFKTYGIFGDRWKNSKWLTKNGFKSLYNALIKRFVSWSTFLQYMNVDINIPLTEKIPTLQTPEEFLSLFIEFGIFDDEWINTTWMKANGFGQLINVICSDQRFKNWRNFLKYMQVKRRKNSLYEKISSLKNKNAFIAYFETLGIQGNDWASTEWLRKNGFRKVQIAILADPRFKNWQKFLVFMDVDILFFSSRFQVKKAKSPKDFHKLMEMYKIPKERRMNAFWIQRNGHKYFYESIRLDPRFNSWPIFVAWMEEKIPINGIKNEQQARKLLQQEIQRLRSEVSWVTQLPQKAAITRQEIEELLSDKYYKRNGVSRAVADFYRAQEEQAES